MDREVRAQSTLTLARHCPLDVLILLLRTLIRVSGERVPLQVTSGASSPQALVFFASFDRLVQLAKESMQVLFSASVITFKVF